MNLDHPLAGGDDIAKGIVGEFAGDVDWAAAHEDDFRANAPGATQITLDKGIEIMLDRGYASSDFAARWDAWLERGDIIIIIFENADLGHPDVGRVTTMPWDGSEPLPPHQPDHAATGLGWRYRTKHYIVAREEQY